MVTQDHAVRTDTKGSIAEVPGVAPMLALLAAAIWQVAPLRKQAMRRCTRPAFVNVRGWPADRDCVIGGIARGRRCVVTCAPVMAAMTLAHSVTLMLALTGLLSIVLAGLAVGLGAWAVLGRGHLP